MINLNKYRDLPKEHNSVNLLAYESSNAFGITPGISTVTFFQSNDMTHAFQLIYDRFNRIVHANPWLAGRLMWIKGEKRLQLVYPNNITSIHLDKLINIKGAIAIDLNTPYKNIIARITKDKHAYIRSGLSLRNKNKPLTQITLSKIRHNEFSLVFSLSHIIADGATYYSILNMLLSEKEIISLNPKRKEHYNLESAIGKKDHALLSYKSYLFNLIRSSIFGPRVKTTAFNINHIKINKIKAAAKAQTNVEYISTNDILTSGFMCMINARLCMMAINFRNRFKGVKFNDAGNYEGVKFYDAGIYTSPEAIRQSLQGKLPYQSRTERIPNAWKRLSMRLGLITNWASFAEDFSLDGCTQSLHLPIIATNIVPFDSAIIFRSRPQQTAILVMSKYTTLESYTNNPTNILSQSLDNCVSKNIFD